MVVGGGLAGLAAATVLAERGVGVTVIERHGELGGRLRGWSEQLVDGSTVQMERGFHAFFRQYYNLRHLLRRVDPSLAFLRPLTDYPLLGPNGATESFVDLPRRVPFNLAALIHRSSHIRWRDLRHVAVGQALAMLTYDERETYRRYDDMTAREYLDSLGFPAHARQMLFDVFSHSFFNPEDRYSAAELLMNFHFYFVGNPEGLVFDVLDDPFSTRLMEPLEAYLAARGVSVARGVEAERVDRTDKGVRVEAGSEVFEADVAVLALDVRGIQALVAGSPDLDVNGFGARLLALEVTDPFAVWRLWLDRPVAPERAPFAGTTGLGLLDNISVFERIERESEAWAARAGGSVVELHAYAVPPGTHEDVIRADLRRGLDTLYPECRAAQVLDERFFVRQDCPAFAPGSYPTRPTVETPFDDIALAGDYLRLPFPSALMERACASGFLAANRLLGRWNVREEPLFSVPTRGVLGGWHTGGSRRIQAPTERSEIDHARNACLP